MIEDIIYNFMSERATIPVKTEKPKTPPDRYYLIERTGGTSTNHINRATIAIQSYGDSLYDAAFLNDRLKNMLLADNGLVALDEIVSIKLNNDYNFTDTTTKHYRYQAVFDIVHY